ncbi:family 78 glycoside hydrolase catalytic domain [Luteolibacter flavescens]|uniref:alpha-L-rhamnosidase n=1 Tax=Luteolibacter flavescens TaxID=1859460 RepID=A0ABT3FPI1_9BACT|nr:family 78 glycoside hydrolase catalytic domain [Luteolibacter flavescens]MCW1885480.1 family 78 glycoside hydrolase catalytic domain [Luteolibacter flavescens]
MPRYLVSFLATTLAGSAVVDAAPSVTKLRCEDLANPTGVEVAQPRLSWWMTSDVRGDTQSAYQVVVDGVWDSGKVMSSQSIHIPYAGPALEPGRRYEWRTRIWDAEGAASAWSETATFATGIPSWSGEWIGQESAAWHAGIARAQWIWFPEGSPASSAPVGTRHFRRSFTLVEAPTRASFTVAADNGFEVSVNGTKAGEGSDLTHPGRFDIAPLLRAGENVITITASNIGTGANPAGLIAGLKMDFANAAPMEIHTDARWQASTDGKTWSAAMPLGGFGMAPWGTLHGRNPARYLRKDFTSDSNKEIARATAYVCGLGFFDLFLNGEEVSDHVMDPALSDYSKTAYYVTFDVTDRIRPDANAVGVVLGNGRFHAPRLSEPAPTQHFGFPKLLLQIDIEYTDGTRATVVKSDPTWKMTDDGPITANNEYDGEEYDARKEMPGWAAAGYDDSAWAAATAVTAPGPQVAPQMIEPMRVVRVIEPVAITNPTEGKYIVDMGENFYGTIRLKASAPVGTTVSMTSSYSLNADGTLKIADNRSALCTDRYTFKGEGVEVWTPRFKGQGFRRFEVSGLPEAPVLANFEGLVISTDVEDAGAFECSDELLNDIHRSVKRGLRMFLRSAPMDPDRDERQSWMGDPAKDAESGAYNFNVAAFYSKWMDDVARSQRGDGSIPDVSMYWNWGDGVEWASVFTILPEWIGDFYGNPRISAKHYQAMRKWVLAMRRHEEKDGTLRGASYGDWCDVSTITSGINNGNTSSALISSAYQYHNYRIMQRLATTLGRTADAATFFELANNLKVAFNARFYDETTHVYESDTQCAYVLALKFGLVPDGDRPAVLARLVDDIMVKHHGHLTVGLIGMQWLMQVLGEEGRSDVAWTIATRTARPSWGYMLSKGATTIWERWDGDTRDASMNSEALLILAGNLDAWFYQYVAGIRPGSTAFKRIVIQPEIVGDLTSAKAHFDSPYGRIASEWQVVSPTEVTFTCTVPANASAVIHVPVSRVGNATITEGGVPVWSGGAYRPGVKGLGYEGADEKAVHLTAGAGTYEFRITGTSLVKPGTIILVDNDSPGARLRGSWTRGTSTEVDQRHGASFSFAVAGTGDSTAEFRPYIPAAGNYKVQARWTSHWNRATDAPFTIRHAGGETTVRRNQEENGGKWVDLGTFAFDFGAEGRVTLTNDADEHVIADAVRFVPVDPADTSLISGDGFDGKDVLPDA